MTTKDILFAGREFRCVVVAADDGSGEPVLVWANSLVDSTGAAFTASNPLPTNPVTQSASFAAPLTRTSDTNAYAANDVLGAATGSTAALSFTGLTAAAGDFLITSAALEIDRNAVISGETSYVLHLYNITPPSALGDNVAWDLPSGDRASYLGFVNLGTPVDLGSTLYVESNAINKQVTLSGTGLFGYLVTVGAYTPASATVHKVTLHGIRL